MLCEQDLNRVDDLLLVDHLAIHFSTLGGVDVSKDVVVLSFKALVAKEAFEELDKDGGDNHGVVVKHVPIAKELHVLRHRNLVGLGVDGLVEFLPEVIELLGVVYLVEFLLEVHELLGGGVVAGEGR